ncbi:hypothetical protein NP233_g434 [Leucocoprinus birnbaumii]|uniref:Uncharacterized protein n=1 Tax=Leucocoprinus birnbaumii TaxID=56174 RepID=A0AAD5W6T9_9AGAR|nr:hypothetical protein NP233_g434 [Leucocoprinus birnbaumii]
MLTFLKILRSPRTDVQDAGNTNSASHGEPSLESRVGNLLLTSGKNGPSRGLRLFLPGPPRRQSLPQASSTGGMKSASGEGLRSSSLSSFQMILEEGIVPDSSSNCLTRTSEALLIHPSPCSAQMATGLEEEDTENNTEGEPQDSRLSSPSVMRSDLPAVGLSPNKIQRYTAETNGTLLETEAGGDVDTSPKSLASSWDVVPRPYANAIEVIEGQTVDQQVHSSCPSRYTGKLAPSDGSAPDSQIYEDEADTSSTSSSSPSSSAGIPPMFPPSSSSSGRPSIVFTTVPTHCCDDDSCGWKFRDPPRLLDTSLGVPSSYMPRVLSKTYDQLTGLMRRVNQEVCTFKNRWDPVNQILGLDPRHVYFNTEPERPARDSKELVVLFGSSKSKYYYNLTGSLVQQYYD